MLAPDPTRTVEQLTAVFNATSTITAWVHALENAQLRPLDPEPAWYPDLNGQVTASQANSLPWITHTGPAVTAGLTQPFIDYAGYFGPVVGALKPIVARARLAGSPTAADQAAMRDIATSLLQRATERRTAVDGLLTALNTYRARMLDDRTLLANGLAAAVKQQDADEEVVQQVRLQISAITQKITDLGGTTTSDELATGKAVAGVIVALTFSLALAGGVVALGGFGLAVLGVGGAAISQELTSDALKEDVAKLAELVGQLADDQAQLALMTAVVANLESLVAQNDEALVQFSGFSDAWDRAVDQVSALLVVLAQPQIDVNLIPDLLTLDDAAAAWTQMSTFATKVQDAVVDLGSPLELPPIQITSPSLHLI